MSTVTTAIVQARPVYYDLAKTVDKTAALIREATSKGAQFVAVGETFLPGYPAWLDVSPNMGLWDHEPTKKLFLQLHQNSMLVPGLETEIFGQLAHELDIVMLLGINERVQHKAGHGTLYNSLITINNTGEIVNHHRKLVPTYTERLVWGPGDARGLQAVDTAVGRVGGLVCWEHWMPLARQALHNSHEQIHVAAWPTVNDFRHQVASRHYAFEGRCFVLAAGSILQASDIPPDMEVLNHLKPENLVQRGGSAIIAPDGRYLAGPVFDEETILTATLDLNEIIKEQMTLDITGHYSRPDVFNFSINTPTE